MAEQIKILDHTLISSVEDTFCLREVVSDYLSLTKPKIIILLLITTVCPMVLAHGAWVSGLELFWALLGGGLVSGSACAMNCIIERDSDRLMKRTLNRPMPQGRISVASATLFSIALGLLGVVILTVFFNPIAATIAIFGHFFYVYIYTLLLKRNTPQNIVIGGAAGAIPPLVGWAAITGSINLTALLLFLVIFLWTPPHFWALALVKNDDYKRAGIPMMPVVKGEKETHFQMLVYALLLIPCSVFLVMSSDKLGVFSLFALSLLSVIFSYKTFKLKQMGECLKEEKDKQAWNVFYFSLLYLALFFVIVVVDSAII